MFSDLSGRYIMSTDQILIQNLYTKFFFEFKCLECGKCCIEPEGGLLLQEGDIERITIKLNISKKKFKEKYTVVGEDHCRRIKYPCPFHDKEHGCTIYMQRTRMCHDYPVRGWDHMTKQLFVDGNCPGIKKMIIDKKIQGVIKSEDNIGG